MSYYCHLSIFIIQIFLILKVTTESNIHHDDYWNVSTIPINNGIQKVHKMIDDPNAMFFLDYWENDEIYNPFNPPISPHISPKEINLIDKIFKRGYQCPVGTYSCASINQPYSCCASSETCINVPDTGLGPVGCCPKGSTCNGPVSPCDVSQGFTGCPGTSNGGCCIPGYSCDGIGCIYDGSINIAATSIIHESVSILTTTMTVTMTAQASTIVIPTTQTTTLTIISSSLSTITAAVPPVRPTGNSESTSTSTMILDCPINYYRCSAYDAGGCCRVGRDCSSTSCPIISSTTITTQNGQTVIIPVTTTTLSKLSKGCAKNWSSCDSNLGGGCCPTGFICGTISCTASNQIVAKQTGTSNQIRNSLSKILIVFLFFIIHI